MSRWLQTYRQARGTAETCAEIANIAKTPFEVAAEPVLAIKAILAQAPSVYPRTNDGSLPKLPKGGGGLVATLLAHEDIAAIRSDSPDRYEERSAIVQFDGEVPVAWAQGFASLDVASPPKWITETRWRQILNDAGIFIDHWAREASALGWHTFEVFGCHRERPNTRIDSMGLVMLLGGHRIVAITAESAVIQCGGARQTFCRREHGHASVAIWELVK